MKRCSETCLNGLFATLWLLVFGAMVTGYYIL